MILPFFHWSSYFFTGCGPRTNKFHRVCMTHPSKNGLALAVLHHTPGTTARRFWAGTIVHWAAYTWHWHMDIIFEWGKHENRSPRFLFTTSPIVKYLKNEGGRLGTLHGSSPNLIYFGIVYNKFSKFHGTGTWNHTSLTETLDPRALPEMPVMSELLHVLITGINPKAILMVGDHCDHPLCPGLQPGPPSQTPGGLGQRYWSVSVVTWPPKPGVSEVGVFRALQPNGTSVLN